MTLCKDALKVVEGKTFLQWFSDVVADTISNFLTPASCPLAHIIRHLGITRADTRRTLFPGCQCQIFETVSSQAARSRCMRMAQIRHDDESTVNVHFSMPFSS